jgi:hypothetical protein
MNGFSVTVWYEKISIKKKTVLCLALECYSHAYISKRKCIQLLFNVESDAIEFYKIISEHIPVQSN